MAMEVGIDFQAVLDALEALFGIPLPAWVGIVLVLLPVAQYLGLFTLISNIVRGIFGFVARRFYDQDTRDFVRLRKLFGEQLIADVERLNREADWNDFFYTELEAEVEVDQYADFDNDGANGFLKVLVVIQRSFRMLLRGIFRLLPASSIRKNLVTAIIRSPARAFLVIGDPGSGKTVSLRHLFLKLARQSARSKNKHAIVPLYFNLKRLQVPPKNLTADEIHAWVRKELDAGQDRTMHEFLDTNFEAMLGQGQFFFLFDSFDEIPAVMDAHEEEATVRQYADALNRFLHAPHGCRGLVASRPYRSPKIFVGQRITILALSTRRVERALKRYLIQKMRLFNRIWHELLRGRDDLLHIARNPFYLSLLARYAKEEQGLPERQFDLFEHFVQTRAETDAQRLEAFKLRPKQLLEQASLLAFALTSTPDLGLEATEEQIRTALRQFDRTNRWNPPQVHQLLEALRYSKLGRIAQDDVSTSGTFSFVHRRFHEYFCTRYLRQHPEIAPIADLAADNRWREVLVLLCEVLPQEQLTTIFDIADPVLEAGIAADPGTPAQRRAIETLRFLRDGFRSRLPDVPDTIRQRCAAFIRKQLEAGNLLDQKRAVESVVLADEEAAVELIETALQKDSIWLKETSIRSCRVLKTLPPEIGRSIRKYLFRRYLSLEIHRDFGFYSALFSSSPDLLHVGSFLRVLLWGSIIQFFLIAFTFIYGFFYIEVFVILIGFIIIIVVAKIFVFFDNLYAIEKDNIKEDAVSKDTKAKRQISYYLNEFFTRMSGYLFLTRDIKRFVLSFDTDNAKKKYDFLKFDNYFMVPSFYLMFVLLILKEFNQELPVFYLVLYLSILFVNCFFSYLVQNYPDRFFSWFFGVIIFFMRVFLWGFVGLPFIVLSFFRTAMGLRLVLLSLISVWGLLSVSFFRDVNFSLYALYADHEFMLASFILVGTCCLFLWLGWMGLIITLIALWLILTMSIFLVKLICDQFYYALLSLSPNRRPKSATEAVQVLKTFKTDFVKVQYARVLPRWLPFDTDWQTLAAEASNHHGIVQDALFQLVEAWEDAAVISAPR